MPETGEEMKDKRPVRCYICGKKMYYRGHLKWEEEYSIIDESNGDHFKGYTHANCIKFLKSCQKQEKK
jgi:hypothetical protein